MLPLCCRPILLVVLLAAGLAVLAGLAADVGAGQRLAVRHASFPAATAEGRLKVWRAYALERPHQRADLPVITTNDTAADGGAQGLAGARIGRRLRQHAVPPKARSAAGLFAEFLKRGGPIRPPQQGPEPSGDEYDDPEPLAEAAAAFAAELDPHGRVRAAAAYRLDRSRCVWQVQAAEHIQPEPCYRRVREGLRFLGKSRLKMYGNSNYMFCPHRRAAAAGLEVRTCHVEAAERAGGEGAPRFQPGHEEYWRISRVGPFRSTGGEQWHIFRLKDALGLSGDVAQSPLWITGKSLGIVARNGTEYGSPPIHIHHAHALPNTDWTRKNGTYHTGRDDLSWWEAPVETAGAQWIQHGHEVWFESHGDSQCYDAQGGADCLMETLPEGFGIQLPPQSGGMAFDADILDVRPQGSEEMEFFIEFGVRWTRRLQKPLRRMQIFRLGEAQVGTYRCSERSESMNWGAVAIPHSGRVMYAYEHSHKEYFHSHFVFAATPEQLGLDQMYRPSEWPDPSDALELEPLGLSIATATSQLFAHLEQAARACRQGRDCKWEPQVLCAWRDPGREPPAEEGQPALRGALWDRSGRRSADCKQLYLEKGRVVTQVIFHPRVDDRDVNTAHSISRSLFYMGGRDYGQHGMSAIAMRPLDGNQRPWPFKY